MEQGEISAYFAALTESCPPDLIPVWTHAIEEVEANRQENVSSMDYMNAKGKKC